MNATTTKAASFSTYTTMEFLIRYFSHPLRITLRRALCVGAMLAGLSSSFAAEKKMTVAADGSGAFKTIQEAVASVPDNSPDRTIIQIKPGTYQGPFTVPKSKAKLTLEGEAAERTILTWDRNVKDPIPQGHHNFNPGMHIQAADFYAKNLTIQNTAGDRGQALAALVDADRAVFQNCRLLGWQDTLMLNMGRQYLKDCYIEGRVDFIYGNGTAVFDACKIHSKNGGYITAANTPPEKPFGFVFLNCTLTGDDKPWADPTDGKPPTIWKLPNAQLGRPWRAYASVAFIDCRMGEHLMPTGWNNWGKKENESTARFAEAGSMTLDGKTLDLSKRVPWAKQLPKEEAAKITPQAVLAGSDGWNPAIELKK
jgi:pectinesterase